VEFRNRGGGVKEVRYNDKRLDEVRSFLI